MNGNGEMIAIPLIVLTLALGVVSIVRLLLEHIQRTKSEKLQAEAYNKMLDKLGSSQEILAWAQSETSQNLFKLPPPERPAPYSRILNAVQGGVVIAALGIAVLFIRTQAVGRGETAAMIIGTILTALGIGLLLSGGASWLLSRKFGLINGKPELE